MGGGGGGGGLVVARILSYMYTLVAKPTQLDTGDRNIS